MLTILKESNPWDKKANEQTRRVVLPRVPNSDVTRGTRHHFSDDRRDETETMYFMKLESKINESALLEATMNKYDPPYSYQEIVDKYGKDVADKLMKDPVHKWRAETGIELIHKEPTLKELNRIWKNWNYMTDDMKHKSDNKSIEFFNLKNAEHYLQLRKEYSNNESSLLESEYESHLDGEFKKKGDIKLSSLEREVRSRNDEGKSNVYTWRKDGDFVGTVLVDTIPASDGYKWFGSLRINKKYRGYGIGNQIIDFVIKCGGGALSVNKDNEIAIKLYKSHGFEISKTRLSKDYYYMYYKKNKVSVKKESTLLENVMTYSNYNDIESNLSKYNIGNYW